MTENRINKFEIIAERRVTEAIKKLRLIGNLANKRNYSYTDKHIKQIFTALENELRDLKTKFQNRKVNENIEFKFKF
jgi:hypothetical protein